MDSTLMRKSVSGLGLTKVESIITVFALIIAPGAFLISKF